MTDISWAGGLRINGSVEANDYSIISNCIIRPNFAQRVTFRMVLRVVRGWLRRESLYIGSGDSEALRIPSADLHTSVIDSFIGRPDGQWAYIGSETHRPEASNDKAEDAK